MSDINVEATISNLLTTKFCLDSDLVQASNELVTDLALDSLELMQLAIEIEEAFGIEVEDDDMQKAKTVGDLVSMVKAAIARRTQ